MSSALHQIIDSSLKEPKASCLKAAGFSEDVSAVYVLDRSGIIIDTNEALLGFTGIPLEDLTGKPLVDLLDGPARQALENMIRDEDPTGVHAFEGAVKTEGTGNISIRALVHPLFDENEKAMGFVVHMQKKNRAAGNKAVPRKLSPEELLPLISDAVIECDHTLRISYANEVGLGIFGCDSLEMIHGLPVADLVHADDREKLMHIIEDCFAENRKPLFSARLLRNDGRSFPAEIRGYSSDESGEKVLRMVIKDLSVKKEAGRFRRLFQTVIGLRTEGVVLVSDDGEVELANKELARIFGYIGPEEMKGTNINQLIESRILKVLTGPEKEKLESVSMQMVRARAFKKNGEEFRVALTGLVVIDESGEPDGLVCSISEADQSNAKATVG